MFLLRRATGVGVLLTISVFVVFIKDAESRGNQSAEEVATDCETPKKVKGACVSMESCPELLALLKPDVRTTASIRYFRQSMCGWSVGRRRPKLCCPLEPMPSARSRRGAPELGAEGGGHMRPNAPTPTPTPQPDIVDKPVDVSGSAKLAMLPLDVCGPIAESKRIKGVEADLYAFPWMALLGYDTPSGQIGYYCGGTLINDRYVLTAAHCVMLSNLKLTTVRLGELHTGNVTDCIVYKDSKVCAEPVEDYGVEDIVHHHNFNASQITNDIALVRLNTTVTFKSHIRPICLPIGPDQSRLLKGKIILTGWGLRANGKYEVQKSCHGMAAALTVKGYRGQHLNEAYLPIVPHSKCAESYASLGSTLEVSPSRQICAGGTATMNSCLGDSGGPFQYYGEVMEESRMIQFGILSFGPRKCDAINVPGVYTRVGFYMDWILDNLRQ